MPAAETGSPIVELWLLRHAHAGDPAEWRRPDEDRPLSKKGEEQAERLGRHLAAAGHRPSLIVSSPKVRALRTAEIVGRLLKLDVIVDARLAGFFGCDQLAAILATNGNPARPLLVGHDPDFTELLRELTGSAGLVMRKGALARVDLQSPVSEGLGVLRWLLPPDLLRESRSHDG